MRNVNRVILEMMRSKKHLKMQGSGLKEVVKQLVVDHHHHHHHRRQGNDD